MGRATEGAIEIMSVGGDHKCWQADAGGVNPMWDDVATLVRARMNRPIEHYTAIGMFPRILILDGVSLYRQLRHRPGDIFHFASNHQEYNMNRGGQIVSANAGQLCAEYLTKTATLAVLFFCQPSGGSAVRSGHITSATRADGYPQQEAALNGL
eukprot:5540605-Pyramimonas_sp.AAC.1